jgi:hypothetical protein
VTRPHRLLDLTNVGSLSDVFAGYCCVLYQIDLLVICCVLYPIYLLAILILFAGYLL